MKAGKARRPAAAKKSAPKGPKAAPSSPDPTIIAAFIVIIAIAAYAVFYVQSNAVRLSTATPQVANQCSGNATGQCFVGHCAGSRTCINGAWSRCAPAMVCQPGAYAPCYEGICARGYKVCDTCGDGYGPCINNSG